jgi:hypothetical protein
MEVKNPEQSPMPDDARSLYVKEARRLARLLPRDVRKPWIKACKNDVTVDPEDDKPRRKSRKPTGLLAPATQCMVAASGLRVFAMALELSPPVTSFAELIERANVERLLAGPLGRMGEVTQVVLLRGIASLGDRALGADVRHVWRAAGRIRKRAQRFIRPGRQRRYDEYYSIALELAPYMLPGDQHDLETALQSRAAASLGVGLEHALRRYELAGLKLSNVKIDERAGIVDVVVPAALRKAGDGFQVRLSPSIAGLMVEYVKFARPFLIAYGGGADTDWLWVSRAGGQLCPAGVVSVLRRQVERVLGVTASCTIFRRANASRDDIDEGETFLQLHQARGSVLGQELYAERDRAEGQQALIDAWDDIAA